MDVNMDLREIVKVLYNLNGKCSVIFLYVKPGCAARVRRVLAMEDKSLHYFDPTSSNSCMKRIVLHIEKTSDELVNFLKDTFNERRNIDETSVLEEITSDAVNALLVSSSDPNVQNVVNKVNKAPPQVMETSNTLFIYPPPPTKGGISITVDDYAVLDEESFLNDVIIDFHLKWIVQNKLSEEQRNKVHTFSTFFYKRLTSKPKKMRRNFEEDPKLTAAQKRHAR